MIDMLAANSGRVTNLTRVTYIVMDEADRMFDLGNCLCLSGVCWKRGRVRSYQVLKKTVGVGSWPRA